MQIVIKIPDRIYKISQNRTLNITDDKILENALKNGIPLPKGHGDLIDKNSLLDELEKAVKSVDDTNKHLLFWDRAVAYVHLSKPIIEADKAESEG